MKGKQADTEALSTQALESGPQLEPSRREFLAGLSGVAIASATLYCPDGVARDADQPLNIARVAFPSSLNLASEAKISALNSGVTPESS